MIYPPSGPGQPIDIWSSEAPNEYERCQLPQRLWNPDRSKPRMIGCGVRFRQGNHTRHAKELGTARGIGRAARRAGRITSRVTSESKSGELAGAPHISRLCQQP
mmetsp:Transcript_2883/g.13473  ORF Transcript_2883/g.13473 Transcript_2883/m.13473 type:complete len:104 (-) Transcript_2883:1517-1828(-)